MVRLSHKGHSAIASFFESLLIGFLLLGCMWCLIAIIDSESPQIDKLPLFLLAKIFLFISFLVAILVGAMDLFQNKKSNLIKP